MVSLLLPTPPAAPRIVCASCEVFWLVWFFWFLLEVFIIFLTRD